MHEKNWFLEIFPGIPLDFFRESLVGSPVVVSQGISIYSLPEINKICRFGRNVFIVSSYCRNT